MRKPSALFARPRGFRKLEVWQLGMDAAESIYAITRGFPSDERYAMTDQLRRAVVSIPSNIAEGNERRTRADHLHFVIQARASLAEVETQLELAYRFGYATEQDLEPTVMLLDHLGRKLHRFSESIARHSA
jgi:four helix bundle protein